MFTRREINTIIVASLVLGFLFSFTQWGNNEFNFITGIKNFITSSIISALFISSKEYCRKKLAKKIGFELELNLWTIDKEIKNLNIKKLPIGVIISLALIFMSNGALIFAAITKFDFKNYSKNDLKRRYKYIRGIEEAIISSVSAIVIVLLVLIFNSLNLERFVFVGTIIAIFSVIPLPTQDGVKMYFGSIWYYLLILLFTIFSLVFIQTFGSIVSLVLSIVFASIITLIAYYQLNK